MVGVQIHTGSPINRAQTQQSSTAASSAHPTQTAPPSASKPYTPSSNTASPTTTAAPPTSTAYPPAYPAAAPPAPTSASAYAPRPTHPSPTRTYAPPSSQTSSSPPPPQSGALPTPYNSTSRSSSPRRAVPPPPKAGERVQPTSYYAPQPTATATCTGAPAPSHALPQPYPPQMGMPTLQGQQVGSGTAPSGAQGSQYLSPTQSYFPSGTLGGAPGPPQHGAGDQARRGSTEHPSGYMQNPYAADMTPEQRFQQQRSGGYSPSIGYSDPGNGSGGFMGSLGFGRGGSGSGRSSPAPPGILTGDGRGDSESYWDTVGGWVKGAGKKLGEAEAEIWKRVNKE
ncbi:MAG: hypothetical protein MMC23_008914 [Stictis urceolatum]|nr:hypothetical protein [Stictis urceolata]